MRVNNPSATVDDLARALDPVSGEGRPLIIGERLADRDFALAEAGLHEGAVVRFADLSSPAAGRAQSLAERLAPRPRPDTGARAGAPAVAAGAGVAAVRELVVVGGLDAGRRFPLAPGTAVVGRAPGCEIVLGDTTLSRHHARLDVEHAG